MVTCHSITVRSLENNPKELPIFQLSIIRLKYVVIVFKAVISVTYFFILYFSLQYQKSHGLTNLMQQSTDQYVHNQNVFIHGTK